MDQILAENEFYKVHSISENVYLIDKRYKNDVKVGKYLDSFYGDPHGAIISQDGEYLVVFGDHIYIYLFEKEINYIIEVYRYDNYVCTVYQDIINDKGFNFFRFVAYDENDQLGIFKMNINDRIPIKIK